METDVAEPRPREKEGAEEARVSLKLDATAQSSTSSKTGGDGNKEERLSYEKYEAADSLELFLKETQPGKPDPTKDMTAIVDEKLEAKLAKLWTHKWCHGSLPFEDIEGLLKSNGDFLVRELEPEAGRTAMACVTVKWAGTVRNYPVHYNKEAQVFTIDEVNKSPDVMELVSHHHTNGVPLTEHALLINPIPRQPWELTSDKITMVSKIGSGNFGEVWAGSMKESQNKPPIDVAIKVKKVNDKNKSKLDEMYKEARLMRQYKHKNVVTFYGIVQQGNDKVMIVMELIHGGSLDQHLKKNPTISNKEKIGYSTDVAIALVYLHSKGCLHRDVACRNCLIDLRKSVVKLSDFGLSKQAVSYSIPDDERLPIRWQAPEVISERVYTKKCDVYSFAILLWEIFNNAQMPHARISNKIVKERISDPSFRPPLDSKLPIVIRRVMRTCWRADPNKRPTMAQAARYLLFAPPELMQPGPPSARASKSRKNSKRAKGSTSKIRTSRGPSSEHETSAAQPSRESAAKRRSKHSHTKRRSNR
ncbi:hypothetical protein Aduo_010844 [Ancylostoma duodenale]